MFSWRASAETITPAEIASHPRAPNVVPALIADLGDEAAWRYVELFTANIRNPHPRRAYARACARFFAWCQDRGHADGDPPELRDLRDRALIATLLIREDRRGTEEEGGGSATARRRLRDQARELALKVKRALSRAGRRMPHLLDRHAWCSARKCRALSAWSAAILRLLSRFSNGSPTCCSGHPRCGDGGS